MGDEIRYGLAATHSHSNTDTFALPRPIRLLEFNRPPMHPWLTVPVAEQEIAILVERDAEIWAMDE